MKKTLTRRARSLRRNLTDAERRIWRHLRNRRLGGIKFRRQVPVGPYIVDFYCHSHRLIIELDGGQHADQLSYDEARSDYLLSRGYSVIRFWNNDVLGQTDVVLSLIVHALRSATLTRSPSAHDLSLGER